MLLKIACIAYGYLKLIVQSVFFFFLANPSKACYISKMIPFSEQSA